MLRVARLLVAVVALVGVAAAARADLTIVTTNSGKGLGMTAGGETVMYLKGLKMRSDITLREEKLSTIIDLDAEQFISINHRKREAEVFPMRKFAEGLQKVNDADVKVTLTATGQKKTMLGQACEEQVMDVEVTFAPGGTDAMTVELKGPIWVAPGSPGKADYARFYKAAADKGLFFVDPRAAKADPGRTKGLTSLYRRMAEMGVAYATDMEISFRGTGPMAALMSKMGASTMTTAVTRVSTDALADDLFAVPQGYATKNR